MSPTLAARQPDFEKWAEFVDDPVGFVITIIGATPQPWQRNALNMVAAGGTIKNAIKSCHGPGKTALLAWILLWWLCTRPYPRVACTAPTDHQLLDKLWPELHKWYRTSKAELWRWFEWEKRRFYLREAPEEWFAVARVARVVKTAASATDGEAWGMQGFHSEHMLFLVDEASGVDDAVYGAIEGALSTETDVKLVAAGNPNVPNGWFYRAFTKHKESWNTMTIGYKDSPKVSDSWAQQMIKDYGINHPWVRVKVLGEFPDALEHGLYNFGILESSKNISGRRTGVVSLGIDVARFGDAKTVFSIADGGHVDRNIIYRDMDVREVALEAELVAARVGAKYIVVDSDGVGAGVTDVLKKLLRLSRIKLIEWHASYIADEEHRFTNTRSELAWRIRDALTDELIHLPDDENMIRQASAIRYDFDTKNRIRLENKKAVKKLIGESPDEWDACTYSLAPFVYNESLPCGDVLSADDILH